MTMNLRLLKSLLLAAVLCAFSAQAQEKWTGIDRYAAQNDSLLAAPADTERVVLLGNSITDFWPTRSPEFFKKHPNLVGRGISGQTSYQMLVRFREDVVRLRPKTVVINCGTNDIAENRKIPYIEDNTMGNIVSMVEIAKANGIGVVLSSVLPSKCMFWAPEKTNVADKVASLNARIKAYAQAQGLVYADYYSKLVYGEERELNPACTKDGVHPTADGYKIMEEELLEALGRK